VLGFRILCSSGRPVCSSGRPVCSSGRPACISGRPVFWDEFLVPAGLVTLWETIYLKKFIFL